MVSKYALSIQAQNGTAIVQLAPPLTTIRQPVEAMGQAAVQMLIDELGGTPAAP